MNGGESGGAAPSQGVDRSADLTVDVNEQMLERAKEVARSIENRVWQAVGCPSNAPPNDRPRTVLQLLLVEDDCDTLLSLAELLRSWHYQVAFAASPTQAIADVLHHSPDVIISDINLPGMDGCALAEELLAVSGMLSGRRPLLIAISGLGDEVEQRCRQAGFDHFLRKPADPVALWQLLNHYAACVERTAAAR